MKGSVELMPLYTIGIPTFNRQQYLQHAINAALHQTYKNIQILICDNASTDGTQEYVKSLCDERIKYIRRPVNKGAQDNFLFAVDNAHGEFFSWLQDDDIIFTGFVANAVEAMVSRNADIYMSTSLMASSLCQLRESTIYSPFIDMDWSSGAIVELESSTILGLSYFATVCNPPVIAFRREKLMQNSFALRTHFDFPLYVERAIICDVAKAGRAIAAPVVEGIYLQHGDQHSRCIVADRNAGERQFNLFANYLESITSIDEIRTSKQLESTLNGLPSTHLRNFFNQANSWKGKWQSGLAVKRMVDEIYHQRFKETQTLSKSGRYFKTVAKALLPPVLTSAYRRFGNRFKTQ